MLERSKWCKPSWITSLTNLNRRDGRARDVNKPRPILRNPTRRLIRLPWSSKVATLIPYMLDREGCLEELFARKCGSNPRQPPITQILIFEQGGRCLLLIGQQGGDIQEDMFSSLLSAICGFSQEALGLEISEIATKEKRIFLAGTTHLLVAIMVKDEAMADYMRIQKQIHRLMERILELVSTLEDNSGEIYLLGESNEYGFLRYEIEMEIARIFPSSHLDSEELGLDPVDLPKLRILTYLWDQGTYTLAKIGKDLNMPSFVVEENLSLLEGGGFIIIEKVRFGRRNRRTYRISELGKLVLDRIEIGFPGLWQG